MSTWKSIRERASTNAERTTATADNDAVLEPPRAIQITALELAVDPEVGCDPYNSTGQFLAEQLKQYQ